MSTKKVIESHLKVTSKHTLKMGGMSLAEEKKQVTVNSDDDNLKPRVSLEHTRWINDKSYTVKEEMEGGDIVAQRIITDLSEDEQQEFQETWLKFWNPVLPQNGDIKTLKEE